MKPLKIFIVSTELLVGVPELVPPAEPPMTELNSPVPLVVRSCVALFWVKVWPCCVPAPVPPVASPPRMSLPLVPALPSVTTLPLTGSRSSPPAMRRPPLCTFKPPVQVSAEPGPLIAQMLVLVLLSWNLLVPVPCVIAPLMKLFCGVPSSCQMSVKVVWVVVRVLTVTLAVVGFSVCVPTVPAVDLRLSR